MPSLKRTPKSMESALSTPEEAFFPHTLHLDKEDIEKFGLDAAKIGSEHTFTFKTKLTRVSQSEKDGLDVHRDMTLSLTDVEAEEKPKSLKVLAERIFTNGDHQ